MIYPLMLVCSLFGAHILNASVPSQTFTFEESDLSKERFLAYFNDLTEEHVAYCMWAMKMDLEYCSLRDGNGYYPLEAIVKLYVRLDGSKAQEKGRLKDLFEQLCQCGAQFVDDADQRLTEDDYRKSPELMSIAQKYLNTLNPQFSLARDAIRARDIHALESSMKDYPELVKMLGADDKATLLHIAAEQFDPQNADTVQIFAYLIRANADVDLPDSLGNSVAMLMHKGAHEASELFSAERDSLLKRALPGLKISVVFDQIKKIVAPAYERARPYSLHIVGGMCLLSLAWYFTRSRSYDKHVQTNHAIELPKVT